MDSRFSPVQQFELFPTANIDIRLHSRPPALFRGLMVSPENLILGVIGGMMVLILFFALGVEQGKHLAAVTLEKNPVQTGQNGVISQPSTAVSQTVSPDAREALRQEQALPAQLDQRPPAALPAARNLPAAVHPPAIKPLKQGYTVQVASYKQEKVAQQAAKVLSAKVGEEAFVMPKGSYSIVCVGKFANNNGAAKFSQRLKSIYKDCYVRRF
ncbi:MAG: SPOR domain-containing protein [Candidatus Omnitrophica bacterium]|nr:SPOR domain-containing protein [Candidatus Omnitrophota bacterium]